MRWLFKSLIYFLLVIAIHQVFATEYQFLQYRVEDGLNTDIIKCISQDDKGFIWIGTDEGLVQYNGNEFITYPQATTSPFVKQFIKLRNGKLLVLDDLGLTEIINDVDTVIFKPVLMGTRFPTDSTIWYPKSVFEDDQGNIWVGEPQSVVKYDGEKLQRFEFGPEHNSSSFIRSFNFVELAEGKLLISSYSGGFFLYDYSTGQLNQLKNNDFSGDISHMLLWNGEVYIGCNYGVYVITSFNEREIKTKQIKKDISVSHFLSLGPEQLLISSFLTEPFIYDKNKGFKELNYPLIAVNSSYESKGGNIWMATEKGLALLAPQIFTKISSGNENTYIESICVTADKSKVFFASKEHIRMYETGASEAEIFDVHNRGYYLSMRLTGDSLWVSNAQYIFLYSTSGRRISTWDLSEYGRYIFDINLDRNKNLWFTQEAAIGLKVIDKEGEVHVYGPSNGLNEELTVVRMGEHGIYAGSNNVKSYLYFKAYDDSVFTNISLPINFHMSSSFRVEDIATDDDGKVWLATSVGVLIQTSSSIERLDLDDKFDNQLVKLLVIQKGTPFVWFSTAYGLVQYNRTTHEYNVYDESHGLPSNSVNSRGLLVGAHEMWVGTSSGLAYSNYNFVDLKETPKPAIVRFYADSKPFLASALNKTQLSPHPNVEIYFSSPSFPANKVRYQYKVYDKDSAWLDLSSKNNLSLSKLRGGDYSVAFRAKKYGNYSWSKPMELNFSVEKAYYETNYFTLGIILLAVLIIYVTRIATTRLLKKRQQELEKLVAERTTELAEANKSLLERNQELDQFVYSTSHDLSAPLKSIRGLINIADVETDPSEHKSLLNRMEKSVIKLEKFIKEVISYSRNARLDVKKQPIHLKQMVEEILDHISHLEHFNKIKLNLQIDDDSIINSDETRIRIILNNLISNAVKFQRPDEKEPVVSIAFGDEEHFQKIIVSDNGQGIPEKYLDSIFNMFYRANVSSDGSGLGLYILRETVQKLGGRVNVESKEGEGSVFTVLIPKQN